jgi:hypothetical protein
MSEMHNPVGKTYCQIKGTCPARERERALRVRERELALIQYIPSSTTSIAVATVDPVAEYTYCRELPVSEGYAAINAYASANSYTFPSGTAR